ncbi:MAG: hypothetical protein NTZ48_02705 [Candidatus Omnitrophica bacterium]|nr:hypothetical protein [Candidatus Omnitrophota bacterium]
MHTLYSVAEDKELVYRLGMAVDVPQFILTTPVTQDVRDRENLELAVKWLYGDLLDSIKPVDKSSELTQDNVVYRALLAFFAEQPESEVVTSVLLAIEKELLEGSGGLSGLQGLYNAKFDILGNTEHIGVAGFYLDSVKENAGIGTTDLFLARLLKQGKTLSEVTSEIDNLAVALGEALRTGNAEPIGNKIQELFGTETEFNLTGTEIEQEAERWLENLKALALELSKAQPQLTSNKLIDAVVKPVISRMKESLDMASEIIAALKAGNSGSLQEILAGKFGLNSPGDGMALANHITGIWIEKVESVLSLDDYRDAVQIASLWSSKEERIKAIGIMAQLKPYLEQYITAKSNVFDFEGHELNLFNIEDIGMLSFYASEVLTGKRTLEQEQKFLENATALINEAGSNKALADELKINEKSPDYIFGLRLFLRGKGLNETSFAQLSAAEQQILRDEFNDTYLDGKISFWAEKMLAGKTLANITSVLGNIALIKGNAELNGYMQEDFLRQRDPTNPIYQIKLNEFIKEQELSAQKLGIGALTSEDRKYLEENVFPEYLRQGILSYTAELMGKNGWDIAYMVKVFKFKNEVTPLLQAAGVLTIDQNSPLYKVGLEEFLIEQASGLGISVTEHKADTELMNKLSASYPFYYQEGIKMFWAQKLLAKVGKGASEQDALEFFRKFFAALKPVGNIIEREFPAELAFTEQELQKLLDEIIAEKAAEDGRNFKAGFNR